MPAPREDEVLVRVARLYYQEDRSQSEVARELGLSRSNVSRILAQARERGVVQITIHDPRTPMDRAHGLEQELQERFNLREAIVLSNGRGAVLDHVAQAGAELLRDRAARVGSIGLSWGHTLQSMVRQLEPTKLRPAPQLLPLVGGLSSLDTMDSGDSVLRVLAEKLGVRPEPLYAPALVESAEAYRTFLDQTAIRRVLDAAGKVEVAFVGVGSYGLYSSPRLLEGMHLDATERRQFAAGRPVGDVCGRFVSEDGTPLGPPSSERVIAVTFEQLRQIPEVVGLVAGEEKTPGLLGVLRSGVLDTLVTDFGLARSVLRHG